MALCSLLRLVSQSAPRMVPVHGTSPAAAARFVTQGKTRTVAKQGLPRVNRQHVMDEQIKSDKEFAQLEEAARRSLAEFSSAVDELKAVGNASTFVIAAIPWVMVIGSNYLV